MATGSRRWEHTVPPDLAGERLDRACAALVSELSRGAARRAIEAGAVTVDGQRVRACGRRLSPGARLVIVDVPASVLEAQWPPPKVLFQDEHLIVVDKPAGQTTAATELGDAATLEAAVTKLLRRGRRRPHVGLVHRLDRETSGLLVFGLTTRATAALSAQLREHEIERVYRAVVQSATSEESGTIRLPLLHTRRGNRTVVDSARGRTACTHWRVVRRASARPLLDVAVTLETGRTHQIRVHMAASLGPIVGDRRYGPEVDFPAEQRLLLHAWRLGLVHPATGERLTLEAALPSEFDTVLASDGGEA